MSEKPIRITGHRFLLDWPEASGRPSAAEISNTGPQTVNSPIRNRMTATDEPRIGDWTAPLFETKIEFHLCESFLAKRAAESILAESVEQDVNQRFALQQSKMASQPHADRSKPYLHPILNRKQEFHLFRKMHFLKFQADRLRSRLDPDAFSMESIQRFYGLLGNADALRNLIAQCNLRLVASIARRFVGRDQTLDETIAEGHLPLIRAVEIFDFKRGTRFSTYATWAIRNSLLRFQSRNRRRNKMVESDTHLSSEGLAVMSQDPAQFFQQQELRESIGLALTSLEQREQRIVAKRFGLGEFNEPLKFREIAEELHISTERVRQLLAKALIKLRQCLDADSDKRLRTRLIPG